MNFDLVSSGTPLRRYLKNKSWRSILFYVQIKITCGRSWCVVGCGEPLLLLLLVVVVLDVLVHVDLESVYVYFTCKRSDKGAVASIVVFFYYVCRKKRQI